MAARATRSTSRAARLTEAVATGPLGALSHDELGVVFDGLADPLQPVVVVAFSSTELGERLDIRQRVRSTKLMADELHTLRTPPFAALVDQGMLGMFQ